jgi:hypothetical protein
MIDSSYYQKIDLLVFVIANIINISLMAIYHARSKGLKKTEFFLGLFCIILGLPICIIMVLNILNHRDWWRSVLLFPVVVFLILELLYDYILKVEFRKTGMVWPYFFIFIIGLNGLIGYSFLVGRLFGLITLITYFLNIFVMLYYYFQKKLH